MVSLFILLLLSVGAALPAGAQQIHVGAPFHDHEDLRKVLDLRCTICHTQQRIDQAIEEERDMMRISDRMLERGAELTERDHSILSHFWEDDPFKERQRPTGQ